MKNKQKAKGYTVQEIFQSMNKFSKSEKRRKDAEKYFKRKGINIRIDNFGIGHLYSPLYVTSKRKD